MPRRAPPSALRLHDGPLPTRGKPKFTIPSLPPPIFRTPSTAAKGPSPRTRQDSTSSTNSSISSSTSTTSSSPLDASVASHSADFTTLPTNMDYFSTMNGSSNSISSSPLRAQPSPSSVKEKKMIVRGPWDSSISIVVPFDVGAVLPPPKRAAMTAPLVAIGVERGAGVHL